MARRTRRRKKTSVALKPNELRGLLSIVEGENASIVCKMLSIKVCFLESETFTLLITAQSSTFSLRA